MAFVGHAVCYAFLTQTPGGARRRPLSSKGVPAMADHIPGGDSDPDWSSWLTHNLSETATRAKDRSVLNGVMIRLWVLVIDVSEKLAGRSGPLKRRLTGILPPCRGVVDMCGGDPRGSFPYPERPNGGILRKRSKLRQQPVRMIRRQAAQLQAAVCHSQVRNRRFSWKQRPQQVPVGVTTAGRPAGRVIPRRAHWTSIARHTIAILLVPLIERLVSSHAGRHSSVRFGS